MPRPCKYGERVNGKCPPKPKATKKLRPCKYGERVNGKCPPKPKATKTKKLRPCKYGERVNGKCPPKTKKVAVSNVDVIVDVHDVSTPLKKNEKIIRVMKYLLDKYIQMENASKSKELYYVHTEYDSNVSVFEGLSNCNKIVLKTKINTKYVPLIMDLFQSIYDKNISLWSTVILENIEDEIEDNEWEGKIDVTKLENYDRNEWLKYSNECSKEVEISDEYVESEKIYDDVPFVCHKNYKPKIPQKVYTLQMIREMLNE